jgi:hypothetical protein
MGSNDSSLATGLRRLALAVSNGQSTVGSWGHTFARPDGTLRGYSMMMPETKGVSLESLEEKLIH